MAYGDLFLVGKHRFSILVSVFCQFILPYIFCTTNCTQNVHTCIKDDIIKYSALGCTYSVYTYNSKCLVHIGLATSSYFCYKLGVLNKEYVCLQIKLR